MSDIFSQNGITRRQLLVGTVALSSTVLCSRFPALASAVQHGQNDLLYVNQECYLLLSLGDIALDEMTPWTWRMAMAWDFHSDADHPLDDSGLQYARERCDEYYELGLDDGTFDEGEFQRLLDEDHPDNDTFDACNVSGQYLEHVFRRGSVPKAYDLITELLDDSQNLVTPACSTSLKICLERHAEGKYARLESTDDIPKLSEALKRRGLPIDIVVV